MSTTQHFSTRSMRLLTALCGLLGVVALFVSFTINPSPPAGTTPADLIVFGNQHRTAILLGAWLQGIGSILNVLFILALVDLSGAADRLAGRVTLLSGAIIVMVTLLEISGYIVAAQAAGNGDATAAVIGSDFAAAAQHLFLIAPSLLLCTSVVLLGSLVLPKVFGYVALALGCVVQILGLVGLFVPMQSLIDNVLTIQLVWIAAAAVSLVIARDRSATSNGHAAAVPYSGSIVDGGELSA